MIYNIVFKTVLNVNTDNEYRPKKNGEYCSGHFCLMTSYVYFNLLVEQAGVAKPHLPKINYCYKINILFCSLYHKVCIIVYEKMFMFNSI